MTIRNFPQLSSLQKRDGVMHLIGHRGARGIMPENTLEGFQFAIDSGLNILECDVLQTKDGIPVVTHNLNLSSATTRDAQGNWVSEDTPPLTDLTLAELSTYDVGSVNTTSEYGKKYPDQSILSNIRIPSLDDLLHLIHKAKNDNIVLLLELKSYSGDADKASINDYIIQNVLADLRKYDLKSKTILHSFDWNILDRCGELAPDMPLSYITQISSEANQSGEDHSASFSYDSSTPSQSIPRTIHEKGGSIWSPYFKDLTKELVEEAQEIGLIVFPWTINDAQDMHHMIQLGVDGMITDYPGRAQHVLQANNLNWV